LIIGALIVALAAYGGYYYANKTVSPDETSTDNEKTEVVPEEMTETIPAGSNLTSLNNTWNLYTNYDLGFSIELPKESTKQGPQAQNFLYPIEVIENTGKNYVYITNDPNATLSSLEATTYAIPWKIEVAEVNNEAELLAFGANKYGETCTKIELEEGNQAEVYNVQLSGEGENEYGFPNCFINGITFLKYYPEANKAVTWGVGQDYVLYYKSGDDFTPYDQDVADSFKFL